MFRDSQHRNLNLCSSKSERNFIVPGRQWITFKDSIYLKDIGRTDLIQWYVTGIVESTGTKTDIGELMFVYKESFNN